MDVEDGELCMSPLRRTLGFKPNLQSKTTILTVAFFVFQHPSLR
jgi:hypothetical protein